MGSGIYKNLVGDELNFLADHVLRHRRNVYATAIGILVYQAAGGSLGGDGGLAALRVHFARPNYLYWFALAALVFFMYRFWTVAPGAWERFLVDVDRQWRATKAYVDVSSEYCLARVRDEDRQRVASLHRLRYSFRLERKTSGRLSVPNCSLYDPRDPSHPNIFPSAPRRPDDAALSDNQLRKLKLARRRAYFRAIVFERSFFDLMVPYLIGWAALVVGALLGP